jgi:hypothetical protein
MDSGSSVPVPAPPPVPAPAASTDAELTPAVPDADSSNGALAPACNPSPSASAGTARANPTAQDRTKEIDALAFAYMSHLLIPFIVGYSLYSAACLESTGWWSLLLSSLTSSVYLTGFIMVGSDGTTRNYVRS